MKKRKYILKCIVSVIMIGMLVCGCGKEEATVTEESNTEMIEEPVSETSVEEEEAIPEEQVADDAETQESVESTEMVDWETFATQADNDDICLVISNEKMSVQTVLFGDLDSVSTCFYQYMEEDKVAVPIRDNIQRVCYYVAETDGSQRGDIKDVYWKDDIINLPYVEIEIGNEAQYYISIFDDADNKYTFGLYK